MSLTIFIRLAGCEDCDQPAPFPISTDAEWSAVKHLLASYYGEVCPDDLDVRYWDEEDFVILSSQEELEEAIRLAEEKEYLQLFVRLMDDRDSSWPDEHLNVASERLMREDPVEDPPKRREPREESPGDSASDRSEPEELLMTEKSCTSAPQQNKPDVASTLVKMDEGKDRRAPKVQSVEDPSDFSVSRNPQMMEYLLESRFTAPNTAAKLNLFMDVETRARRRSLDGTKLTSLQDMMAGAGDGSFDEGRLMEDDADDSEPSDFERTMLPGALSGANVIAIEMPEMEHHGTETAEPAEIAETGEVSTKSSRDAETGFWMQPRLEAEVKAELRRKLSALVTGKERASHELQQRKQEHASSRHGSSHKKKKCHGEVGRSSTSLDCGGALETLSEEMSGDAPPPLPRKHERRSGKSDSKKKKHCSDLLTEDAFIRFMSKFETQLRKDMAKEVAKKTVRSVIKNLPKQMEGSDTASTPPAVSTKRSGYVHEDIICDFCDREIVGTRYICGNCPNYDLCEECEDIHPSVHDPSHVFIKLRRPCVKAGTHHGVRVPLLKRVIYDVKEEERKVEREGMLERCAAAQQFLQMVERAESRNNNNNNKDEEEEEVKDEQEQRQALQMEKQASEMKKTSGGKGAEDKGSQDFVGISRSELMEMFWPSWKEDMKSELQISVAHHQPTESARQAANSSSSVDELSAAGNSDQLEEVGIASGGLADFDFEAFAQEYELIAPGEHDREEDFMPPLLLKCGFDIIPSQTAESVNLEQMALDEVEKKQADAGTGMSASALPTTGVSVGTSTVHADQDSRPQCDSKADDTSCEKPTFFNPCTNPELGKDCICCYCELCRREQPSLSPNEEAPTVLDLLNLIDRHEASMKCRELSPASSIEVVETDHLPTPQTETEDMSQETPVADKTSDDKAECKQQEVDETSFFSSLSDESSGEEDFVVIVPDCFDISKPLSAESLARLAQEKEGKQRSQSKKQKEETGSNTTPAEGPHANIPAAVENHRPLETFASKGASFEEMLHLLSNPERNRNRHPFSTNRGTKADLGCQSPRAERLDDSESEEDEDDQKEDSASAPHSNPREQEREESTEKADAQKEDSIPEQGVILPTTEASVSETRAAEEDVPEREEPADGEQSCEAQEQAEKPATEVCHGSDADETDLKCPPESDEEGAVAAADSAWDPNQQLSQMMTNTLKKAGSGLQQVLKTGKDIFRTLQRGDSYEFKESGYVYKPSDFKLPESTWQPSSSEYTPPKSNFTPIKSEYQLPKSTYTAPQTPVPAGVGAGGEYAVPLQRIREMGYFNNQRTLSLLRKHQGDMQKVVDELLDESDNDWAESRHGNAV